MLLPRFTIRQMLLAMVGFSFICMVLGFAARGSVVAHGMGLAMVGLFVPFGVYAVVYWTVLAASRILPGVRTPDSENTTLEATATHASPDREPSTAILSEPPPTGNAAAEDSPV